MRRQSVLVFGLWFVFVTTMCEADLIEWSVSDGGNDHFYEGVTTGGITWTAAKAEAEAMGGYLATITSMEEEAFVAALLGDEHYRINWGPWLGGWQLTGSIEPDGGWQWVTAELWNYTNWYPGEPSNGAGNEHYLHYYRNYQGTSWNDASVDGWPMIGGPPIAYVVEYNINPIPAPSAVLLGSLGLTFSGWLLRRRRML